MLTAVSGAWADASGSCGTAVTWSYVESTQTLTISGTGAMADYNNPLDRPWIGYVDNITSVVIGSGVTKIGICAFNNCENLTTVTFDGTPTLTSIGDLAFIKCSKLASITLPAGVTSIGMSAFDNCTKLESINIPAGVTSIGVSAFSGCEKLASISFAANTQLKSDGIGDYAFQGCTNLKTLVISGTGPMADYHSDQPWKSFRDQITTVTIESNVTTIGDYAFEVCTNLTAITIPAGVTVIGIFAFAMCSNLASVTIPASVTSIGIGAFYGCTNLPAFNVDTNNPNYSSDASGVLFNKTKTTIVSYPAGKTATTYEIPTTVTSIGNGAFSGCTNLTSVTIPASVATINNNAFLKCTSLASISFAANTPLKSSNIGTNVFQDCTNLKTLVISGTGEMRDYTGAFYENQPWNSFKNQITTVTIESNVTTIGMSAFYNCTNLTSVTLPASVTSIGNEAFLECSSMESISIPASVTSIGYDAFGGCTKMESFNVAEGNANYASADGVLFNKDKTTLIQYPAGKEANPYTIPSTVTAIGENAFIGCAKLASVTIPANVTSIGNFAFSGCTSLASVTIPAGVTSIGAYTFSVCTSLASVTFAAGSALTSIGYNAFYNCTNLGSVTIPASVTTIGNSAFFYCTSLASVIVLATTPPALGSSAFEGNASDRKIYVPSASVGTYKNATNWITYKDDIVAIPVVASGDCGTEGHESEVTWEIIGTSPNYTLIISGTGEMKGYDPGEQPWKTYNGGITTVVIGNGVTNIGKNICYGYPTLTYVSIPASVTSIGEQAFKGCEKLTSVSIPDDVTSIGKKAFNGCISLSSINIPAGIETFDRSWFDGCSSLTAINVANENANYSSEDGVLFNKTKTTLIQYPAGKEATTYEIPTTVTSIGNEAFSWSTKLTSVIIPTGVTTIGDYAFSMSEKLASVTFAAGSSLTSISDYAFFYCENLTSITIPAGVTSIGKDAFYGCSKLTSVSIPAGVTSIGEAAFYYCTNLASINIPAGVTSIGADLFSGCSKLASVTIPASVTTIGDGAFRNCALTSIEIPASVTSIGMGAFLQCGNLGAITMNSSPLIGYDAFEYIKEGAVVAINAPAHDADSYQWATFYNQNYAFQADDNTQVFKVTLDGTTVTLLEVTDKIVNAGTPVVLKSTGTPVMTLTTASSSDTQENNLVGTYETIPNPGNAYVLNNGDNGVGFYKLANDGTIEFGKAYLVATAGAREFLTLEEATGIETINHSPLTINHDVYDIHGRRVNGKPSKGLYIINGKKVIMK